MEQGEVACVWDAPFELSEESIHEWLLTADSCDQGDVCISGEPGLAPALESHSPYEAEPPVVVFANRLQFRCRPEDIDHVPERSRANKRCCSTSPEVGSGANGAVW